MLGRTIPLLVAVAVLLVARVLSAGGALVPAAIQADLLSKLSAYDKGFPARAGGVTARVLILTRPGDPESEVSAAEMKAAFARLDKLGGLRHEESVAAYEGAESLARRCRSENLAIVYFTPGLSEFADVQAALSGLSVLTVTAVPEHVPKGVVLGFDLESGKPKIVLNLPQARKQMVDFPAKLLQLMRVHR